jgi:hypothetical protein
MAEDTKLPKNEGLPKSENKTTEKVLPKKLKSPAKPATKVADKKIKKDKNKLELKVKVVRDSFTMPQNDYAKLDELKLACLKAGFTVKKSELLRAGLQVLCKLTPAQLKKTIAQIEHIKTGRPKND